MSLIHPAPFPLATTTLSSVPLGVFLFCYVCSFVLIFRFHMYTKSYYICFSPYDLFHFSIQPSRSVCVVADVKVSFLWLSKTPLYVLHTTSPLSVHLSMDSGFPLILAIGNKTVGNIRVHTSLWVVFLFSLEKYPEGKLLHYILVLFLIFFLFMAAPAAYGRSQARGWIGAAA